MLWKICGMREPNNINEVLALQPNYMGFIFFEKSPRNALAQLTPQVFSNFPSHTQKVGVFVNAPIDFVLEQVHNFGLNAVQLHGAESPEYCQLISDKDIHVWKAFSVDQHFDFKTTEPYIGCTTFFLFDTKAPSGYGGHGKSFDWTLLSNYTFDHPFLLAGGIGPDSIEELKHLSHPALAGFDLNSKFEISPGLKEPKLIAEFLEELKAI